MAKPIIIIISCRRDEDGITNQAIRDTWLREWGHLIDYRFVVGKSFAAPWEPKWDDVLMVHALDNYKDLSHKVWEANRWAFGQGYTHTFKCDTDTYCHIPRLLASDYDRAPYIGNADCGYCAGGSGYWLGPAALQKFVGGRAVLSISFVRGFQCCGGFAATAEFHKMDKRLPVFLVAYGCESPASWASERQ